MRRERVFIFIFILWLLAACQNDVPLDPDMLPANYDYAGGAYPNPVTLKGVTLRIEEARVMSADPGLKPGYVYVVVRMDLVNQSGQTVNAAEFSLIDEYLNLYKSWQTSVPFSQELTAMPATIGPNQVAEGEQVFLVPAAALQANLRLRWESAVMQSRIDLALNPLNMAP